MDEQLKPQRAANKLLKILDGFCMAHPVDKFPINIDMLTYEAANLFHWDDPVSDIVELTVNNFDGALLKNHSKSWTLLYNPKVESSGRILFTKAHELGHYVLHKSLQDSFRCGARDMLSFNEINIESEANTFASYLLMPLDDFRQQVGAEVTLFSLSICASRYGVSLTAAILRWLEYTDESAILIISRDGFMNWACSSKQAKKNGAFFSTKKNIVPIPENSLASNTLILECKEGANVKASIWFEYADKNLSLKEYKLVSEKYDQTMTLIVLPKGESVWKPQEES